MNLGAVRDWLEARSGVREVTAKFGDMTSPPAGEDPPAAAGVKPQQRVHQFAYADDEFSMNQLQKSFFNRTYLPSVLSGDPVDVQGQHGYPQVLLHRLIGEYDDDPAGSRQTLQTLLDKTSSADLPYDAQSVMADFLFLEGDFAGGIKTLGLGLSMSLYLTLAENLDHPPLTASLVLKWGEYGITKKAYGYLRELEEALQNRLDAFHARTGISMVEDFWRRLNTDKPAREVAADVADEVVPAGNYTEDDIRLLVEQSRALDIHEQPQTAFGRYEEDGRRIGWPAPWVSSVAHYGLLRAWLRRLARDAENTARDTQGIPRVGERWVSEIALLRQVEALLPGERIVHQARPFWLAPQSLDIFLPDYDIGIEYQGIQHSGPVEFFGGEETYDAQLYRDDLKRQTCEENGCTLIEVHPGYRIEDVLDQVKEAISHRGKE